MLTASLGSASIGIKVHVPDGFPGTEPANNQTFSIRMDHVYIICIALV